jgi:hypothetical protein
MGHGAGRRDVIDERSHARLSELRSNAKGVLFLLLSARASLLRHGADDECRTTMEECVASFRARHKLTHEDTNPGTLWKETGVGALLWLLEYAHGEVSERLQDLRCAEQLETCIDRFPICALLVFLHLMEGYAERIREPSARAPSPNDGRGYCGLRLVDRVRSSTSHHITPVKAAADQRHFMISG